MPPKTTLPTAGTFAAAIYMHRDRLGLTQDQACDLFPGFPDRSQRLPRRTWQGWELGGSQPAPWICQAVIDKLARTAPKKAAEK